MQKNIGIYTTAGWNHSDHQMHFMELASQSHSLEESYVRYVKRSLIME